MMKTGSSWLQVGFFYLIEKEEKFIRKQIYLQPTGYGPVRTQSPRPLGIEPMKSSLHHPSWTLLEPTVTSDLPPRTAIYVNNKFTDTNSFTQVNIPLPDVTAVSMT